MWLYLIIGVALGVVVVCLLAFASLVLPRKGKSEYRIADLPEADWQQLCKQAACEQDLQTLLALTDQISRQLDRKRRNPQPLGQIAGETTKVRQGDSESTEANGS
jgi:hypothetical protein